MGWDFLTSTKLILFWIRALCRRIHVNWRYICYTYLDISLVSWLLSDDELVSNKLSFFCCSIVAGFPGLCSCCPVKPLSSGSLFSGHDAATNSDQRTSSVAELRRKAQEHSTALLQSLHQVASFQQHVAAAAALQQLPVSSVGLGLPLPSLTTLQALARKSDTTLTSSSIPQTVPLTLTPPSSNGTQLSSHES